VEATGRLAIQHEARSAASTVAALRAEIVLKNAQMDAMRARLERMERNTMYSYHAYGSIIFLAGLVVVMLLV
jgi:hypothetical protein